MSKFLAALAAAATFMTAAPTFANDSEMSVSYRDLNLAATKDQAKLDSRLKAATGVVCRSHGARDLTNKRRARDCETAVLSDARSKAQVALARANTSQQLALAE
jgi:UrcA family protein